MSNRSERREAERTARKLAFQVARQEQTFAISQAQLTANRANAQLSTGAVTPEGKAISSHNALKTGLTGRAVLLPTDDAAEYQHRLDSALDRHCPAREDEHTLVQSVVDIDWRLDRIVRLETGIYIKGLTEFADKFRDQTPSQRDLLIQTETYLKYEKSLRNLHIQESRLQRQRTKNLAELKRLQDDRARCELALKTTARPAAPAPSEQNGFDFSTPPPPLNNNEIHAGATRY